MARTCTICAHADRDDLDLAIVSGQPQRAVAAAYRVSHDAVRRHASNHLAKGVVEAAERRSALRADDLLSAMLAVVQEAQEALRRAKMAGDERLALFALREVRESIKALTPLVTAQSVDDADVLALVRALGAVLPRHPTVGVELATELRREGSHDMARVLETAGARWHSGS